MIVDLNKSDEQIMVEDSLSSMLAETLPIDRLRLPASHGGGAERLHWEKFVETGVFGLGLAEDQGGFGFGRAEEVLAAKALGRHLASPTLIAQMVAPHLAEPAMRADLVSGRIRVAMCQAIGGGRALLIDGADSHLMLVVGPSATLAEVPQAQAGTIGIDETLSLSHVEDQPCDAVRSPVADHLSLLIAAYLTGIAEATQAMAVDYAKTREQFGQPIGAFQAIKHICADMAVRTAAAEAQAYYASITFGRGGNDRAEVAAARLLARDAAIRNGEANIQVHGGMGFTAECDAHLFLKRARVLASICSSQRAEQARLLAGADEAA